LTCSYKWMPVISAERCTGCGLCVDACGPRSLEMVNSVAALTLPDTCGSEEHCIGLCRDDAIAMAWVPFVGRTTLANGQMNRVMSWQVPSRTACPLESHRTQFSNGWAVPLAGNDGAE
jgi:MinD superfamily P-loop ATPase